MFAEFSIPELWLAVMSNIYYLTAISIIIVLILENRNPVKSLSWAMVLIALPILGLILYVVFGQNIRRTKIISKKSIRQVELINGYYETLKSRFSIDKIQLPKALIFHRKLIPLLYKNNHALFTTDNEVSVYISGSEALDAMYAAIEKAKSYVHLQSYIFDHKSKIGKRFVVLLQRKAAEGVEVRLLTDSVGSWGLNTHFHNRMKASGIHSFEFLKVRFPFFTHRVNYRNHRKILVVDGVCGFVGGVNIADRYYYGAKAIGGVWRDTQMKVEGSAVNALQSTFIQDWYFASRCRLDDKRYFFRGEPQGDKRIQVASCGPDSDWRTIEQAFVMSITNAQDYVFIQSPYFLPTESVCMALKVAAMSGIDVRLVIPHQSDGRFTQYASLSYLKEMLEAGVRVYRYKAGFVHSKMMVVDDSLVTIGSSNMDFRSFESNFEINAFVYDLPFAQRCKQIFETDFENSYEVTKLGWERRPKINRVFESFARLFSPLL